MHVGIAEWKIYWKLSKGIIWLIQSHTTARIEVVKRREAREGGERERERALTTSTPMNRI